jgi:filamentous hemagglutinin family protein
MINFHPSYFFDLSSFKHAVLFEGITHVWEVLNKISPYLKAQSLGVIEVDVPAGVYLINPELISIGKGTVLEPGSYIKGPCIIGEQCTIRHGAYIRGDLITGNKCVIGHDTEVKNTIMLNEAHAAHFAYLGDSVLGNRVNLGAGTKCANLKFDNSSVIVTQDHQKINTGLRKFGAIIGDDTQIGCNAVTNPGTLLGKKVMGYPAINFGGFIPSGSRVKSSSKVIITGH